jgi:hypothetical protein
MDVLALIVGVALAVGGGYANARAVAHCLPGRVLPAFGYPNIYGWNWLGSPVPLRVRLLHGAGLVAGVFLIATSVRHLWPGWGLMGLAITLVAALLPVELVRRHHNRRVRRPAADRPV